MVYEPDKNCKQIIETCIPEYKPYDNMGNEQKIAFLKNWQNEVDELHVYR